MTDRRVDPVSGDPVVIVGARQKRPNLPSTGCPFCVGGLESPEPYTVRSFPNRWPALPPGRAEVVLYSPEHDATFWELGVDGALQVVDMWAERTAALGREDDVEYVLVFENRGPEVGATIQHPHGQIYAFDHVPPLPARSLAGGNRLDRPRAGASNSDRLVAHTDGWSSWVPHAPSFPYALRIAPDEPLPDLASLGPDDRRQLAELLVDATERLDRLFDARTPYMLWIHQRPTDGGDWPGTTIHVDIVSPWRSRGVMRFVAAGELGSGEYFNPVVPEEAAAAFRAAR